MKTLTFILSILLAVPALPCSRIVWGGPNQDVIVGRNMDWFEDMKTNMWLLPRGMARDGLAGANSLKWTSKYGSVVFTAYDIGTAEGMNEKGLNANVLYLTESDFGVRDENIPGLSVSLWPQYFLDNYATVAEAYSDMQKKPFQVLMASTPGAEGRKGTVHLSLADKTGDTLIIEYIDGKPVTYHGRQYTVMTNSPTYDKQLEQLKQYKGFGGNKNLPGTTEAADRFVRAAFYLARLPAPQGYRESVAGVFSVLRNVSQPFGESDPARPNISPTRWRVVADLTKGLYFYESVFSPNIVWVDLKKLNFKTGAAVQKLDLVREVDLVGDVSGKFKPAKMFQFHKPDIPAGLKALN